MTTSCKNCTKYPKELCKKERDSINIGIGSLDIDPQVQDQSNNVSTNETRSCPPKLSKSSNIQLLRSHQIIFIKHNIAKFQISNELFPNHFLHPNKRLITLSRKTQESRDPKRSKNNAPQLIPLIDTAFCTPYNSGPCFPMTLKFQGPRLV